MCSKIIHSCLTCGKAISEKGIKKAGKLGRKFCSKECHSNGRLLTTANKRFDRQCRFCLSIFQTTPSKSRIYCSKECNLASMDKARAEHARNCSFCFVYFTPIKLVKGVALGNKIDRDQYCSHLCSRQSKMKHYDVSCKKCSVIFTPVRKVNGIWLPYRQLRYCSEQCALLSVSDSIKKRTYLSSDSHPNWVGGTHRLGGRGSGWHKIAEKCRELHGRKCKRCGMAEEENGRRLDVNHIIPFHQHKNKTQANKQSNLEALCRSCHTKTDWEYRKSNQMQICLNIFD